MRNALQYNITFNSVRYAGRYFKKAKYCKQKQKGKKVKHFGTAALGWSFVARGDTWWWPANSGSRVRRGEQAQQVQGHRRRLGLQAGHAPAQLPHWVVLLPALRRDGDRGGPRAQGLRRPVLRNSHARDVLKLSPGLPGGLAAQGDIRQTFDDGDHVRCAPCWWVSLQDALIACKTNLSFISSSTGTVQFWGDLKARRTMLNRTSLFSSAL